jgi:hypothetical protein
VGEGRERKKVGKGGRERESEREEKVGGSNCVCRVFF